MRCVLIGSESLLIQCEQCLRDAGHRTIAVVSRAPAVCSWAAGQSIPVLADARDLLHAESPGPIDLLISVTNLSVVPADVVALARHLAINFHDGPLPEYAGLNVPVWALLNGERQHGITWHVMTAEVDRGAILVERRFDISEADTALTLNTRCYEAGIDGFEELVARLGRGELAGRAQPGPIQRYYGRAERPAAVAIIDWNAGAEEIARVVRALDFGAYANPVGSARANVAGVPLRLVAVEPTTTRSGHVAGTVVACDVSGITIATGDADLRVLSLETSDGRILAPLEAQRLHGMEPGFRCSSPSDDERAIVTGIVASSATHEAFWRQRLATRTPAEIPYVDRGGPLRTARPSHLDLAGDGLAAPVAIRVAAVVALLARLADKATFDLGWSDPALRALVGPWAAWFADQLPLRVAVDFTKPFAGLVDDVAHELARVGAKATYASDLIARAPELKAAAASTDPRFLPVTLEVVDCVDASGLRPGVELGIAFGTQDGSTRWHFDASRLSPESVVAMQAQLGRLLAAAFNTPDLALGRLDFVGDDERGALATVRTWVPEQGVGLTVPAQFNAQARRTPARIAVSCRGVSVSYAELDRRANQLARQLRAMGCGADKLVGLMCPRSVDLVVGLLGIQKAGGAYVPLDPSYPRDRLAHMVQDSGLDLLVTVEEARHAVAAPSHVRILSLDGDRASIERESGEPLEAGVEPHHLAYVIYTSGSTGLPKGVMVEHRNVVNFFAGMDRHLGGDPPGTWLAVTSLSFDISVLELCWTIARGYTVAISADDGRSALARSRGPAAERALDFSLFYFSSDESEGGSDKYRLLMEGARFADQHGFAAVWTPERHFHAFGGLYPNPAVTGAAIAAVTQQVQIRAGSVVLPLHHPLRVAEEWSVVDNLSKGRVGVSFASGWQPNDFVLRPQSYADNKNVMLRDIDVVRRLWRGEALPFEGPLGGPVATRILPRPVQKELPFWVTSAGNPETFAAAGRLGANVLTHLLGQTVEELRDKIAAYRRAYREAGHPGEGYVSLMLHTFVGPDEKEVRARVRQPLIEYLRSSLNLVKQYAWSFPAFKRREGMDVAPGAVDLESLSKDEMDALLEHSFERYYETSGLFGAPQRCLAMIDAVKAIGVDDVACLIDFGVDAEAVLAHLTHLDELRRLSTPLVATEAPMSPSDWLARGGITHLQCTPSMAKVLVADEAARAGLAALTCMMVGGEALPPSLAAELKTALRGRLMNMYGPTETTIWSSTQVVERGDGPVPLGAPLVNQQIYILDRRQQPLPAGVPGELVIGGDGVVRGYLGRDELTAERFLTDPYSTRPGARMYRTGDLARRRSDGALEFLGRLDHQVKVRGYRIELGEIEATLAGHPGVRDAVVVAREDVPGDLRLVAYVVGRGSAPSVESLRDHIKARLPDFMVPAHVVVLAALPQTPNGKIDRQALPAPEATAAAAVGGAFIAPAGEMEAAIAAIWKDVLKLPQVGSRDNFFDLGGHSLLAVQAHRRLKESLQRELSITDIFRFPTIQSLAGYLAQDGAGPAAARDGAARAEGRRAALQRRQAARPTAGTGR